ncbi:hypothetical protein [Rhizobium sp. ZW T2_16]|uniref:hypothetical protein n=1 Tax=Rhizobium sp. ZW T2_16 TaxID=3378083 RepID=UPI003851A1CE
METDRIGVCRFDRNGFVDMLQGQEPEQIVYEKEFLYIAESTKEMVAAWRLGIGDQRSVLPNILVGTENQLRDVMAYARSYLKGLGPVSGLIRLCTSRELSDIFSVERFLSANDAGIIVSLIFGEIASRLGNAADEDKLTLSRACNTLVFCLARAHILHPSVDSMEVLQKWAVVTKTDGDRRQMIVSERIVDLFTTTADHLNWGVGRRSSFMFADDAWEKLGQEYSSKELKKYYSSQFWAEASQMTAEGLLRTIDNTFPQLMGVKGASSVEKSAVMARLISKVNSDLSNQLIIARPMSDELPELGIFLGKFFAESEPGKIQSVNDGIGWKIAARLSEHFDPYGLPVADLSWSELQLGSAVARDQTRNSISHRVEILSGIDVARPADQAASVKADRGGYGTVRRQGQKRNYEDALESAERNLEEAMEALRALRRYRHYG